MIRTSYAIKLARTKMHSKRGTLFASIAVASLLFAVLIAIVIIFTGAEKSASEFIKKAGNDQYLVKAQPNIPYEKLGFQANPSLDDIRKIRAFEKEYYDALRDKYGSLGLEYSKESEVPALTPSAYAQETLPEEQRFMVNFSSPVIQEMNTQKFEEYAKKAKNKLVDLKLVGAKYNAAGYYIVDKSSDLPSIPRLRLIQNNKENFSDSDMKTGDFGSYGYYTNSIHNGSYSFTDQKVLERYLLTTDSSDLKGIPVVVSAQEATLLFGGDMDIGKEPEDASKKRVWLKDVQTKLNGQTYQVCYRNAAEQTMLEKIQRDYAEIKNNEKNKDYIKPNLIYDYPTDPCGDISTKQDTRSNLEKQTDAKYEDAQRKLGSYVAPMHQLLTFQIVGIKHAQPYTDYTKGVDEYVKSLLASQDDSWSLAIPIQMYESLSDKLKISNIQQQENKKVGWDASSSEEFATRILEFSNVEDARLFLDSEACPLSSTDCDKKFLAAPYGSNYLILDEISKLFNRISTVAFPAIFGLAAIIIWFTISRIMAENRKETAIYRAMGAKRRDVTYVYIVYILLIALRIAFASLLIGIAIAFAVDYFYGKKLTDTAVTLFGIVDNAPSFSLFNVGSPLLVVIVASIFAISITASVQPLVRNVRRSPILDMRDDN